MLPPPKLYEFRGELRYTIYIFLLLLLAELLISYNSYREFISKPFYFTNAYVTDSYMKHKKGYSYIVLKLKSDDGLEFFTTTSKKKSFKDSKVRLEIFPNKSITFYEYMSSFYVKSKIKSIIKEPDDLKSSFVDKIYSEHNESKISSFFSAIFLATPLDKEVRKQVSKLGVSHLIALSGLHLGLLWIAIYTVLLYPYKFLQQRYFPYRYMRFDLGVVILLSLGYYLYFVDYPPSLLRAYFMLLFSWLALIVGIELLSFEFILSVVMFLLILIPKLLFSIAFWLSVFGVFYIFLILEYNKKSNYRLLSLVLLPLGVYLLIQPVVHTIFTTTTIYQLLSPILSLLFTPFYIVSILLHIIGLGDLFDSAIGYLLHLKMEDIDIKTPIWFLILYIYLSYKAIKYERYFYILVGTAILYNLINIIILLTKCIF